MGRASGGGAAESRQSSFPFPLLNPVYNHHASSSSVRNAKTTQQQTTTGNGTPSKYGPSALSNHRLDDKPPKLVYPSYSSVLSAAAASIAAEKATMSNQQKKRTQRQKKNGVTYDIHKIYLIWVVVGWECLLIIYTGEIYARSSKHTHTHTQ